MDLAERLKSARKDAGFTQQQVAERSGIDDSSLSAFENGRSEPRLAQLDKLAEVYHLPLRYFFEDSEPKPQLVMWRNKPANNTEVEAEFLQLCRQYRQLEIWTNEVGETKLPRLDKSKNGFGYPQVQEMAFEAHRVMGLGDRPGQSLYWVLEEVFGVKIFHLDLGPAGIAACAVSDDSGEAILLNKKCSRWRRNHDLAHELFHLLTWQRFGHGEGICEPSPQEERFATCFAGNLLLPTDVAKAAIYKVADSEGNVPFSELDKVAREFDVSLESLFWRMQFLFNWDESRTQELVDKAREYVKTAQRESGPEPPLFPECYRALAIRALQSGNISTGRFAKLMRISRMEAECYIAGKEADYADVSTAAV